MHSFHHISRSEGVVRDECQALQQSVTTITGRRIGTEDDFVGCLVEQPLVLQAVGTMARHGGSLLSTHQTVQVQSVSEVTLTQLHFKLFLVKLFTFIVKPNKLVCVYVLLA